MIQNILIDQASINCPGKRLISQLSGATAASVEIKSYARGGGEGVSLGGANYLGLGISFGVTIIADSQAELLKEKQRFVSLLACDPTATNAKKTFTFVTVNNDQLTTEAVVTNITHDLKTSEFGKAEILVQIQTERSYLLGEEKSIILSAANLGGMPIPMNIPMAMNLNSDSELYQQLYNAGSAYSHLNLTVTGPAAGFALINQTNGKRLQTTLVLEADDKVNFDFYTRTAILNQNQNILETVSGDWWSVAPGINKVLFVANNSGDKTKAQINYFDAYMGI